MWGVWLGLVIEMVWIRVIGGIGEIKMVGESWGTMGQKI